MNIYKYIAGLALCISFQAFAWQINFVNNSDGEIIARIIYAAPGICSLEERIIAPGGFANVDTRLCCTTDIELYVRSGKAVGKVHKFATPRAGINMTCANIRVNIFNTADNNISADVNLYW